MTMNYEKITVPRFAERLKSNMYKNITAARRAIGKADWTEQDRLKAHSITNKHFNVTEAVRTTKPSTKSSDTHRSNRVANRPVTQVVRSSRSASAGPSETAEAPTNAEIIDLCGVANELVETLRKTGELSMDARPILNKGAALLYSCLEIVANALKGTPAGREGLASTSKVIRDLGRQVTPQPVINHKSNNEGDSESRSAAGAGR